MITTTLRLAGIAALALVCAPAFGQDTLKVAVVIMARSLLRLCLKPFDRRRAFSPQRQGAWPHLRHQGLRLCAFQ